MKKENIEKPQFSASEETRHADQERPICVVNAGPTTYAVQVGFLYSTITEARAVRDAEQATRASLEERTRQLTDALARGDVREAQRNVATARAEAAERERDDAGNILIALNATLNGYPTSLQLSSSLVERVNDLQLQLRSAEATLKAALDEIEKNLDWLKGACFVVEHPDPGGLGAVVRHSDAMHALLFVRKVLREAALTASPAATK